MINNDNIDRALDLYDAGKSVPEILSMFPEDKKELEQIFSVIEDLNSFSKSTSPSPTLLYAILSKLPKMELATDSLFQKFAATASRFKMLLLPLASALVLLIIFIGQHFIKIGSQVSSVDEISQQLLTDSTEEQLIINDSDSDIQLVKNDSQLTENFSDIINENEY